MSIDKDLIAELQDSLAELGTVLSRDLKHRRLRLGPILSERDLLDVDLIAELQDSLAELGTVLSRDVIQSWTPQQFFEALHYSAPCTPGWSRRRTCRRNPISFPDMRRSRCRGERKYRSSGPTTRWSCARDGPRSGRAGSSSDCLTVCPDWRNGSAPVLAVNSSAGSSIADRLPGEFHAADRQLRAQGGRERESGLLPPGAKGGLNVGRAGPRIDDRVDRGHGPA